MKIKRCGWLLLAVLCLSPAANNGAETCFTPLYYPAMFEPVALQAETCGNPNLMAESDVLTATGKDPHETGNECIYGVNNGSFDLILRNAEAMGPDRIPMSFRLRAVRIAFRDKEGTVSDRTVRIEDSKIDKCFGTPMPLKVYRSFDDPAGRRRRPESWSPEKGSWDASVSRPLTAAVRESPGSRWLTSRSYRCSTFLQRSAPARAFVTHSKVWNRGPSEVSGSLCPIRRIASKTCESTFGATAA